MSAKHDKEFGSMRFMEIRETVNGEAVSMKWPVSAPEWTAYSQQELDELVKSLTGNNNEH